MKKSFTRLKISAIHRNIFSSFALICFGCITPAYSQQVTIFLDEFESGGAAWTAEGVPLENMWVFGECAGNGPSATGATSAYISTGNVVGCGQEFEYINADAGSKSIVLFREVDAGCGTNLSLSFDYQITGDANDFGEVVYSTDGGTSWILVPSGLLGLTTGWDTQTIGLPASLENATFHLGFRFTYDNTIISNPPLAIDNVHLQAISEDFTPPTLICPADDVVNIGSDCTAILSDYAVSAIATDNCSSVTLSQQPEMGEILISGNHTILIEAEDASGNSTTCTFNLFIQESQAPQISCPAPISTCDPVVVFSVPQGTDNCIAINTQTDVSGLTSGDTFPIGVTTLSYHVADSSGNSASCSFTVEVLEYPDLAIVGSNIQLCDTISAIISANTPTSGVGEWSVIQGGGALNNPFSSITGINNLSIGDNLVVWTISSTQCGTSTDTLMISVSSLPLPASTVDTIFGCNAPSVQLTGNQPSAGVGLWYDVNGSATFSNPNGVPTTVSNLQGGWNQIVWSISNGSCPVSRDTANVYISEQALIIQPNVDILAICLGSAPVQLVGVEPQAGTSVQWSVIQGDAYLYTPFEYESLLTNFSFGSTNVVYEMRRSECPATTDTLFITADICSEFGDFPNMITPNGDGLNDVWVLEHLASVYPECVVRVFNRWGNLVFESIGYQDNWDGTHNGNRLPMGTYYYTIELNDTDKKVLKGNVSIIY